MATEIVSPPRVNSLIPFPTHQEPVTQATLEKILSLRNYIARLKSDLETAESEVRAAIESGIPIQAGVHTARLKTISRRNVSWKAVAERLAVRVFGAAKGAVYCARVLTSTKPSTSVALEIS